MSQLRLSPVLLALASDCIARRVLRHEPRLGRAAAVRRVCPSRGRLRPRAAAVHKKEIVKSITMESLTRSYRPRSLKQERRAMAGTQWWSSKRRALVISAFLLAFAA